MKKELKAQVEALIKEKLTDEELDSVAGGTHQENIEILNAMISIDPKGTMDLLKKLDQRSDDAPYKLNTALFDLVNNNFRDLNVYYKGSPNEGYGNVYFIKGKQATHQQFMSFLNKVSQDFGGGDDF